MEETNTAPVQATSENNQPTNTETTQPVAPVQNPNTITLTEEQMRFFNSNGGMDKVFGKIKDVISNPPKPVEQPAQPTVAQTAQVQQPVEQAKTIPQGYITPEEYMTEQYFKSLSTEEKYAGIAEQIRSGEVLKEMSEFGIKPTQDGMFNDGQIRKFLDLKAQTVPAVQTTAPITNTPTVEWSNYEKVDSFDAANKIILENMSHPGQEHPKTAEAKEFLKNFYNTSR